MQGLEELDSQFTEVFRQLKIWRPVSRVHPSLRPALQPLIPAATAPRHRQGSAVQESACYRGTAGGIDARPSGIAADVHMVHSAPVHRTGNAHLSLDRRCNLPAGLLCDVACWPPGSSASAALAIDVTRSSGCLPLGSLCMLQDVREGRWPTATCLPCVVHLMPPISFLGTTARQGRQQTAVSKGTQDPLLPLCPRRVSRRESECGTPFVFCHLQCLLCLLHLLTLCRAFNLLSRLCAPGHCRMSEKETGAWQSSRPWSWTS